MDSKNSLYLDGTSQVTMFCWLMDPENLGNEFHLSWPCLVGMIRNQEPRMFILVLKPHAPLSPPKSEGKEPVTSRTTYLQYSVLDSCEIPLHIEDLHVYKVFHFQVTTPVGFLLLLLFCLCSFRQGLSMQPRLVSNSVFLSVPSDSWRWSNAPRSLSTHPPLSFVLFHLAQPWTDRAFSSRACHLLFGGQAPATDLLPVWNSPYSPDCPQTPHSLPASASQMLDLQARTMRPDSLLLLFKWSSAFHEFTQIHKLFASSPKYSHFPLTIQRIQF